MRLRDQALLQQWPLGEETVCSFVRSSAALVDATLRVSKHTNLHRCVGPNRLDEPANQHMGGLELRELPLTLKHRDEVGHAMATAN